MTTADIETELSTLPDRVADALGAWKKAEVEKRREHARLYLTFKAKMAGTETSQAEIKSLVYSDSGYYKMCLDVVILESEYVRVYEKLMCSKKAAALRTSF